MKRSLLDQVLADRAAKRPVIVATQLSDGAQQLIYPENLEGLGVLAEPAARVFRSDQSTTVETPEGRGVPRRAQSAAEDGRDRRRSYCPAAGAHGRQARVCGDDR